MTDSTRTRILAEEYAQLPETNRPMQFIDGERVFSAMDPYPSMSTSKLTTNN